MLRCIVTQDVQFTNAYCCFSLEIGGIVGRNIFLDVPKEHEIHEASIIMIDDSDNILAKIRDSCDQMRECINSQHPEALLKYLWAYLVTILVKIKESGKENLISSESKTIPVTLALEMLHATWSGGGIEIQSFRPVEKNVAVKLINLSEELYGLCLMYFRAKTESKEKDVSEYNSDLAQQIYFSWFAIRGKRYPVMEKEYFGYVLEPHSKTFKDIYGRSVECIASEIQKYSESFHKIGIEYHAAEIARRDSIRETLSGEQHLANGESWSELCGTELHREICNSLCSDMFCLSKQTRIPEMLLSDLAFVPGEDDGFFDDSKYSGTPLQMMPSKIKPLIKMNDGYYCTEPFSLRDSLYRSLKFAVGRRKPGEEEIWNCGQKRMSESAFGVYMPDKYKNAKILQEVYYPHSKNNWTEVDCIVIVDDTLICVEVKAGNSALSSPVRYLNRHFNSIERLIMKSFDQTKRFVEYIETGDSISIYRRNGSSTYEKVQTISQNSIRRIVPIGLTLETFTPHSSTIKEFRNLVVGSGQHPYICMSIDDLLVLSKLFDSLGEFVHYLEFRQSVGGMKKHMFFDELGYACRYIEGDRRRDFEENGQYDRDADIICHWEGEQSKLDEYFNDPDYFGMEVPKRHMPKYTTRVLDLLESNGTAGWLSTSALIRDMLSEDIAGFEEKIVTAMKEVKRHIAVVFNVNCDNQQFFICVVKKDTEFTRERAFIGVNSLAASQGILGKFDVLTLTRKSLSKQNSELHLKRQMKVTDRDAIDFESLKRDYGVLIF